MSTGVALVQGFGLAVSPESIGAINGLVLPGLSLMDRRQVSPKHDVDPAVLSRAS